MKFGRLIGSLALAWLGIGVSSDASASSDVDLYNVTAICTEMYKMAEESAPITDRLGTDSEGVKARRIYFGLMLLPPASRLKNQFGDAWPSLSKQLHTEIAGNLQKLWSSDADQFDQMAAHCEKAYQASKK